MMCSLEFTCPSSGHSMLKCTFTCFSHMTTYNVHVIFPKLFHIITHFFPLQVFFSSSRPKPQSSKGDLVESAHQQIFVMYQKTNGCLNGHAAVPYMTKTMVSLSIDPNVSLDMSTSPDSSEPQRGMCLDIAIMDSAYFLSQIVLSLFVGSIVELFSSVTAYMVCALVFSLFAIVFGNRIVFTGQEMEMLKWLICRLTVSIVSDFAYFQRNADQSV